MRLNVFLARTGAASSRRKADDIIRRGGVKVNGEPAAIGQIIDPASDEITIGKKRYQLNEQSILIALNKPAGYTTTKQDKFAVQTVYELLPPELREKVHSIGRLDKESRGLLLFTNDGAMTQRLTHPSHQHEKQYRVTVKGVMDDSDLEKAKKQQGVPEATTVPVMSIIGTNQGKTELDVTLKEGKNRHIRRMFEYIGFPVINLIRTRIEDIIINGLKEGDFRHITSSRVLNKNVEDH